ncbi:MAG: tryptophan-rich sensory protein [Bacteroidaceae bacterium]|nr:tryptophan-rich sensory protein [Bacteroidaceae bacterium]MBQ6694300.1 tryptophan-rich sensory protein [Bacteroidaceae bacterium]
MKRIVIIALWVLVCLFLGSMSSLFLGDAINDWYPWLVNSQLSPPGWVFPVAWTILYILMGISVGLLYGLRSIYTRFLYVLFVIQLVLNILWTMFFFYLRSPILGFVDIILLDMFVVIYFVGAYVVYRPSAWLFVPYILWLAFATYLNGYIMVNN